MNARLGVGAAFLTLTCHQLLAQTCTSQLYPANAAGSILVVSNDSHVTASNVAGAVGLWQSCSQVGSGFPSLFANSGSGEITFGIVLLGGLSTSTAGGCGQFRPSFNGNGQINGGTIELFDATLSGNDCEPIREETIAHEMGHGLGLGDQNAESCYGHIMGPPLIGGSRSVHSDECSKVDDLWTTPAETPPPPPPAGGGGGPDYGGSTNNEDMPCFQGEWCFSGYSPIIINFEKGGCRLTGSNLPVSFDMAGNGHPVLMGWTAAGADEAFLWLDRNQNGRVTSGAELFGNFTPLVNGHMAKNGFEALRDFDSNNDGVIDERDPIWSRLMLWRDLNHNGVAEPGEIAPLQGSGVIAIDLHYHWAGRHDTWGNAFRYESHVSMTNPSGHLSVQPVYDIFFVPVKK